MGNEAVNTRSMQTRPLLILTFLNATAFGIICPILFFIIELPDSKWIALLIVMDLLGRMVGRRVLLRLQRKFERRKTLLIAQMVFTVSFAILMVCGAFGTEPALIIICISRFVGGLGLCPWVINRSVGEQGDRRSLISSIFGFAVGAAFAAVISPRLLVLTLLHSATILHAGEAGGVISLLALVFMINLPAECFRRLPVVRTVPRGILVVGLLAEMGYGMNFCILPLMLWETFHFSPAGLALFLSSGAILVAVVWFVLIWCFTGGQRVWLLVFGLTLATLGFAGFMFSWWIAFADPSAVGTYRGLWMLIICFAMAVAAFAILQFEIAGPGIAVDGLPDSDRRLRSSDDLFCITGGVAAVVASLLWSPHERTSFAVPALLMGAALLKVMMSRRLRYTVASEAR